MKISARLLIAINIVTVAIPSIAFAHPGHGDASLSNILHQVLYHASNNSTLIFMFIVLVVGLSVRAFLNK